MKKIFVTVSELLENGGAMPYGCRIYHNPTSFCIRYLGEYRGKGLNNSIAVSVDYKPCEHLPIDGKYVQIYCTPQYENGALKS